MFILIQIEDIYLNFVLRLEDLGDSREQQVRKDKLFKKKGRVMVETGHLFFYI